MLLPNPKYLDWCQSYFGQATKDYFVFWILLSKINIVAVVTAPENKNSYR